MDAKTRTDVAEVPAAQLWKRWEGQTVLNEFRLLAYLGGDDQSAVFLTEYSDPEPQRAAIKLVEMSAPEARRIEASWQMATGLSHPNLIRVFQAGYCHLGQTELAYAVMDYAEENLSQIVPQRALTGEEAADLLKPALAALAYLHEKGLVHGQLKPSNVMAKDDVLKLSVDGLRRAGEPAGPAGVYDAPETESSPAGDVWSLGAALVEVLTQRPPFWVRDVAPEPDVPATLPAPHYEIARRSLRRDPAKRWTVDGIAKYLESPTPEALPVERASATKREAIAAPAPAPAPGARERSTTGAPSSTRDAASRRASASTTGSSRNKFVAPAAIAALALVAIAGWKWMSGSPKEGNNQAAAVVAENSTAAKPADASASAKAPASTESAPRKAKAEPRVLVDVPKSPPAPVAHTRAGAHEASPAVEKGSSAAPATGVVREVLPNIPHSALGTIRGTVRLAVRVSVDGSGNVSDAQMESPGPSQYFAKLALAAARQWKFPPSAAGASARILHFELRQSGASASVSPAASN